MAIEIETTRLTVKQFFLNSFFFSHFGCNGEWSKMIVAPSLCYVDDLSVAML